MKLINLCPFKVGDKVSYAGWSYGGTVVRIEVMGSSWMLHTDIGRVWSVYKHCSNKSGMRLWEGK